MHSPAAAGFAISGIMKWLLYLVILLALLIGAVFLIGYALPAKTTASRSITLQQRQRRWKTARKATSWMRPPKEQTEIWRERIHGRFPS